MTQATRPTLRLAPHIGFPDPASPLFGMLAAPEPVAQLHFLAANGFDAFQDPFAAARSIADQARIGEAAAALGLASGCFVYGPLARARGCDWVRDDPGPLERDLDEATAVGRRIGSRHIAVITGAQAGRSKRAQRIAMAANLRRMADRVAPNGFTLAIEAVNAERLPGMLLNHLIDALEVVEAADHPGVRLIFDVGHVQAMDGDPYPLLEQVWDKIALVQVADHPGRGEPGSGKLDLEVLFGTLAARRFEGLVELEHGWSHPGPSSQRAYLDRLRPWLPPPTRERTLHGKRL